nr:hypothetical protein [Tanacetum cinerariifolium]
MPPRMRTRSTGRLVVESCERGIGERVGRGGRGRGPRGEEFCPSHEMKKLETKLWNHVMVGAGHAAYINRFHELARLVPYLLTTESKKIERNVYGLAPQIRRMEERIWVLGPSVPPATPTMHLEGLVAHALAVTAGNGYDIKDKTKHKTKSVEKSKRSICVVFCFCLLSHVHSSRIMPLRMRTRSVGRPVAESREGGTGERVGRGGRGRGPRGEGVNGVMGGAPDFSTIIAQQLQNLLPAILAQVGNQENVENQNGNVVNKNIQENVRNVLVNSNRVGCSYKEFLACNPKEYNGKKGVVVLTLWIEKMESVQDMSGCSLDQKMKYTVGSFVGKALTPGHAGYTDRFHELARNRSIKKVEKRGNVGEPSKDRNGRDDNKRTRTGNAFATTANPIGRENTGAWPKCTTYNSYHAPGGPCHTCFNCNRPGHFAKDYRVIPRNVNPINVRNPTPTRGACYECGSTNHLKSTCPRLNREQGPRGNRPNQVVTNNGGQARGNQARGRAFMLGAEEVRQDPNIVTGTFTLKNHFATTLFDSGADYSFVSTTFIPLLGIEPSELGFRYEIEIAC